MEYIRISKYLSHTATCRFQEMVGFVFRHLEKQSYVSGLWLFSGSPIWTQKQVKPSVVKVSMTSWEWNTFLTLVIVSGNITCVFVFNHKSVDLKPSFSNILKCLSIFDILFLVRLNIMPHFTPPQSGVICLYGLPNMSHYYVSSVGQTVHMYSVTLYIY